MAKERKEKKEKKSEKAEKVVASADSDMEVDAPAKIVDVSPIAAPMAADKLTKKLLKTVKKGKKTHPLSLSLLRLMIDTRGLKHSCPADQLA